MKRSHQQPAALSGEPVAEVREFCGLRIPTWVGTGDAPDLPIGTKLYTEPQSAPIEVEGLAKWMIENLLTDSQLSVVPPGQIKALRHLAQQPAVPDCRCIDCGGDQPGHDPTCKWMAELHGEKPAAVDEFKPQEGQSCYVTDNPADVLPNQRTLPLYTEPFPTETHTAITHCDTCGCDWLDNGLNPIGCPYCKQSTEIERLRAEVERLRADRDSWEQQASDRVVDWHVEHLRAEKLVEALALLPDEIEMVEHNPDEGPITFCCGREVKHRGLHDLHITHDKDCWYVRMSALRDNDQEDRNG